MKSTPEYSLENGMNFAWSSLTGKLNPERVRLLEENVSGTDILDAGCGGGAFVEFLASKGLNVTGLDYHAMFLDRARSRPDAKGKYFEGDITALPFPDQSFDLTYCFDVLEHVDDAKALSELIRVTRKRIIIAVPASDQDDAIGGGLTFHHYRDLTHLRTYTNESLKTLFESAGQRHFKIIPELPVDLNRVASEHLKFTRTSSLPKTLVRNALNRITRLLVSVARYDIIYTGLTAVIDLESRAQQ